MWWFVFFSFYFGSTTSGFVLCLFWVTFLLFSLRHPSPSALRSDWTHLCLLYLQATLLKASRYSPPTPEYPDNPRGINLALSQQFGKASMLTSDLLWFLCKPCLSSFSSSASCCPHSPSLSCCFWVFALVGFFWSHLPLSEINHCPNQYRFHSWVLLHTPRATH